ncbi:hypothetical protein L198_05885 [Cryptococcus wingfieldii CBS 7118]|uniref:Major facilitator superfamily (MFS) profile domain-containing protein n=1 Tax=Cryptococcus wingfieldii CBS 7118 TaxID=1295528 RepID=A0A1E3IRW8_9TREE|nr:hypothetical protein L198_05885 [Cryptococcus wingfieldii CBS 7118]ODN91373.1 hypothetical protein L198_05885 [Cryptococcus wingfieldii CBS 7118]
MLSVGSVSPSSMVPAADFSHSGILHVYWTNTLFPGEGAFTLTLAATLCGQPTLAKIGTSYWSSFCLCRSYLERFRHSVSIGCIYPLCGALYVPCATLLFEWFFERGGLATGIMYAGTGLGGTIVPYIMDGLLKGVGYKAAMCSLGIAYAVLGGVALIFIDRRIPISRYANNSEEPKNLRRRPLPHPSGTALVSILNAASIPGTTHLGYLSDHLSIRVVISISSIGSSLACALLWGWGTNTAVLVVFAIVFGLLGPSFSALWSGMIKDDPVAPTMIFSVFAFFRGVGNITSGPISGALLKVDAMKGATGAYGFINYGILLIYTAVTIMGGAATGVMFKPRKS